MDLFTFGCFTCTSPPPFVSLEPNTVTWVIGLIMCPLLLENLDSPTGALGGNFVEL